MIIYKVYCFSLSGIYTLSILILVFSQVVRRKFGLALFLKGETRNKLFIRNIIGLEHENERKFGTHR